MRGLARVPPNFFGIPFGLCGLAVVWRLMERFYGSPPQVADTLFAVAAAIWLVFVAGCAARLVGEPRGVLAEVKDSVLSPFWAIPSIVGMMLAVGLEPYAHAPAKVIFLVFLIATITFGGWLTGQWIAGDVDQSKFHPGYFIPTVAGSLVAAQAAPGFGLRDVGWMCFGIGVICWFVLGSLILNRLVFIKRLPPPLVPTLAIEVAPAAITGVAYFALHGSAPDTIAYLLAGYAVLMVLVQVRLIPIYAGLAFTPGFWAFTFSWAIVANDGLRWLHTERPEGNTTYAALVAGAISALIAAIAARTLLAVARGQFLPAPASVTTTTEPGDGDVEVSAATPREPARLPAS